jgi:hypothetical protein
MGHRLFSAAASSLDGWIITPDARKKTANRTTCRRLNCRRFSLSPDFPGPERQPGTKEGQSTFVPADLFDLKFKIFSMILMGLI